MSSNFPSEVSATVQRSTETLPKRQTLTREESASYSYKEPKRQPEGEPSQMQCPEWKGNKW